MVGAASNQEQSRAGNNPIVATAHLREAHSGYFSIAISITGV